MSETPSWLRGVRPGSWLGPYCVEGEIARGGMGIVYRARHGQLGREVALKVLLAGEQASPQQRERFRIEARATARLRHPQIVAVHEVGEVHGLPFFAMDFVRGRPLDAAVAERGPWGAEQVVDLGAQLAAALSYAHSQGVLHRDLKPSNMLLDEHDRPYLSDFGLAKEIDSTSGGLTRAGVLLGTPHYCAPEQAAGAHDCVDVRSDVYGLGATLYFALTGVPPVEGESLVEVIARVVSTPPVPPSRRVAGVPRDLEVVLLTCLEKDPALRYASAAALAEDLERVRRGQPIRARPLGPLGRLTRRALRHPGWLAAAVAVVVALVGVWGVRTRQLIDALAATQAAQAEALAARERAEEAAATARAAQAEAEDQRVAAWRSSCAAHLAQGYAALEIDRTRAAAEAFARAAAAAAHAADDALWAAARRGAVEAVGAHGSAHPPRSLPVPPTAAAFDLEGRRMALCLRNGSVQVVDLETSQALLNGSVSGDGAYAVALGPRGRWCAASTPDGEVWVGALEGAVPRRFRAQPGPLLGLAFDPEGRWLLGGAASAPSLWDLERGVARPLAGVRVDVEAPRTAETWFAPEPEGWAALDAEHAVVVRAREVRVWSTSTGARVGGWELPEPGLAAGLFRGRLMTCEADGTVRLWGLPGGEPLGLLWRAPGRATHAVFAPEQLKLLVRTSSEALVWVDLQEGRVERRLIPDVAAPRGLAIRRAPTTALILGRASLELRRLWALPSVQVELPEGTKLWPGQSGLWVGGTSSLELQALTSRARRRVSDALLDGVATRDGRAFAWRTPTGIQRVVAGDELPGLPNPGPCALAWTEDGSQLLVASRDSDGARIDAWGEAGRTPGAVSSAHRLAPVALGVDRSGRRAVTADLSGAWVEWALGAAGWEEARVLEAGDAQGRPDRRGGIRAVGFDASGSPLRIGADGYLERWTEAGVESVRGHPQGIAWAAWSPDGTRLATVGADEQAVWWDLETLRPLRRGSARAPLRACAWSDDALWTLDDRGRLRRWGDVRGVDLDGFDRDPVGAVRAAIGVTLVE